MPWTWPMYDGQFYESLLCHGCGGTGEEGLHRVGDCWTTRCRKCGGSGHIFTVPSSPFVSAEGEVREPFDSQPPLPERQEALRAAAQKLNEGLDELDHILRSFPVGMGFDLRMAQGLTGIAEMRVVVKQLGGNT
jgi:hypothetical protein